MEKKQGNNRKGRYDPCTEPSDLRPIEGQGEGSSGANEHQSVKTDPSISPKGV